MSDISKRIASLSPEKRALLELALKKKGKKFNTFPLSFSQKRLWLLYQLNPESTVYNLPMALKLEGKLSISALEKSFQEIVKRHEAFRTRFAMVNGEPVQIVSNRGDLNFQIVNLFLVPPEQREAELRKLLLLESNRPFNLEKGPLYRIILYQLEPEVNVLYVVMHHIISDGWSMGILANEFSTLYESFRRGEPSPLPPLTLQYADYAAWQQKWFKGEVYEKQLNYWRKQLSGASHVLELPTDRPRTSSISNQGEHRYLDLPKELTEKLRELSRKQGVTMYMLFLAAFNVLLHRYSGQKDISVGTTIANRNRKEIERIIGFFVNTLVLRTDLSGDPLFTELLKRVKEVALGAFAHQDFPFEKLVEELQPDRDSSRTPLFQVMFTYQAVGGQEARELPDLKISNLDFQRGVSTFDLTFVITESPERLRLTIEFNNYLFRASTIMRMLYNFRTLLENLVENPERPISQIPILSESELQKILYEWNETDAPFPEDRCIHQIFEAHVREHPDNLALVFDEEQMTYGELNRRANQLAHYLRKKGVGPEVLVGLFMNRSVEMVVGILGIFKAGGAYVPLDPAYPHERLEYMISDSGLKVLLSQESLEKWMPAHKAEVVYIDRDWEQIALESDENPPNIGHPDNLAYVIYTSGSTGKPKGTLLQHRGLVNITTADLPAFPVNADSRVLQFSSLSFDASVWEIMMTLMRNATLCLTTRETVTSGEELVKILQKQQINMITLPPSVLAVLPEEPLPALEALMTAGEKCTADLVNRWAKGRRFFNGYGPTEATICASTYSCESECIQDPPIGRPIPNFKLYVLDAHLQPVPIGVPGELHIGGVGLARGYLNRPDLTAEKFIPNHLDNQAGGRLYKTGDLVRFLPDGNIEFLGRIDHQVKIRGFRVELGEIESLLSHHHAVKDAIVIARDDERGNKRLIAYFIARDQKELPAIELRNYLKERLPDYMVPAFFVQLEKFPLTPNGKVDRKALPDPDFSSLQTEVKYVPPRTPTEELLCGIWSQILWVDKVGIYDSFFDLGGHSLLATQLISRIRDSFGVELPLNVVFETPTVSAIAERIERAKLEARYDEIPPFEKISREGELPLSFSQQRLWFLDQLEPGSPFYNIPAAFRLIGPLNIEVFERAINEVVKRHEILRTVIKTVDGKPQQVILDENRVSIPLVDLTGIAEKQRAEEVRLLSEEEARRPFNLATGPLFRAILLRTKEDEHVVLFTMHHIISDGWSMEILVKEVGTLYQAFSRNKPSPLKELPIQYADFAHWQRKWLQGEVYEKQIEYWKTQLGDAEHVLNLPTDRPRPASQTYHGKHKAFVFPKDLAEGVRRISRQEGGTMFMTLLAAFVTLLYHYSRQEDISVGTPVANRNHSEIEGLIGFFVNTLVLRTRLDGNPTFRELLRRVRETALGAYLHQDIPFEKLVEEIQPERDLSHTPLFQVMFSLQNTSHQVIEASGLRMEALPIENKISQFDLTLMMEEREDGLHGSFEYNTDLFEDATIDRMIGHFRNLLKGIVANPQKRISDFPILSESEQYQLMVEWNQTSSDFPREKCLHQLFEERVKKTPGATAVVSNGYSFSFAELNTRANQLAHYLRKLQVGPEVLVGLSLERSFEMLVGLLGILKAGGAYVPLDPNYPRERLDYMVRDSNISVLITESKWRRVFPEDGLKVVCLDEAWETIGQEPADDPVTGVDPDNVAYVIYTSGSTGQPKGVQVRHRSVVNHNLAVIDLFGLQPSDRVLQFATINFDAAVEEIFPTWLAGATLVLRGSEKILTGEELLELVGREKISVLDLPTAYWHELVSDLTMNHHPLPDSLRLVVLGGDKASPEKLAAWNQLPGKRVRILNTYGPTETTIISTAYDPGEPEENQDQPADLPIGRPIANTRVYVLDPWLRVVPVGVPGELHVGGEGVARGYLNRPDLTAERFIPDPFSGNEGERLYKTGDLVRYLPDGNIQFLGRVDHQVKIRGYRIEISEIEEVLLQHPAIKDVTVVAREDVPGVKRLVAYCVPKLTAKPGASDRRRYVRVPFESQAHLQVEEGRSVENRTQNLSLGGVSMSIDSPICEPNQHVHILLQLPHDSQKMELDGVVTWQRENRVGISFVNVSAEQQEAIKKVIEQVIQEEQIFIGELRGFLTAKLPEYMIPSAFVVLDEFPRTPSGKIDRRALPRPDAIRPDLKADYVAPRTPAEKILARIWQEVLGLKEVGVKDNFFELGGDSILSIQVIAKAKQAGLQITPVQMFQHQTIEKLAAVAGTVKTVEAEQSLVVGEAPLTPIQHWFFEQNFPEPNHWNQSTFLSVKQNLDPVTLYRIARQLIQHHDVLRVRFRKTEREWRQVYSETSDEIPFKYIDLSRVPESRQSALIEKYSLELKQSLNINEGPLLWIVYFYLGAERPGRLLITIHHLAVDGVSWRILMEDIQSAMHQLQQGRAIQLPPKTTSYLQWSRKLKEFAQSETLRQELTHWLAIPAEKVHPLPVDNPGGNNSEAVAEIIRVSLSEEETRALLQEVPAVYSTQINEVLLTALVRAFSRWTGKRTLLVDLEGHGREELFEEIDISRTVGWFTTVFPVFLDLKTAIDPGESLKTIKEQIRKIPRRGIGYGLLRYLVDDEAIRENILKLPRAQISFNYLGQVGQALEQDSPFTAPPESAGPDRSYRNPRSYLLDIDGIVSGKQMHIRVMYSREMYRRQTVEELTRFIADELRAIIKHCKSPDAGGYTASDFPLAKLDQDKLNKILGKLNKKK